MKKHISHPKNKLYPCRALTILLGVFLMIGLLPVAGNAYTGEKEYISAGLYFVKNALAAANLQNVTGYGSGYQIGIYDEDQNGDYKRFISLTETEEVEISVLIDHTMYLSGGDFYDTPQNRTEAVVGAYHLELVYAYDDVTAATQAAANYPGGFVAYSYGNYYVRFGSYTTFQEAASDAEYYSDCIVTGNSEYGLTVVSTLTGEILFELDLGADTRLGVMPIGNSEIRTWCKGNQYNGGFRYTRPDGGYMHVVNIVPLEQYVAAVLSREFVPSWPDETLKAAACCIRTFVSTSNKHMTFDVCNDVCCQVYRGVYQHSIWSHLEDLCEQTAGQCIYYEGQPILAVYHSSNGGATVSSADSWHTDYPYLQEIYDPFESLVKTGAKDWSSTYSTSELTELARNWGFSCGQITNVYVSEYTELGNVAAVTFVDSSGKTHTFTGEDTLLLGSSFFSRRYVIIPPNGSATVTDISLDGSLAVHVAVETSKTADGTYAVFNGSETTTVQSLTVLTANGTEQISGSAEILSDRSSDTSFETKTDYPEVYRSSRTVYNNTNQYMVYGSGWGHNVGLSAYGAYAMGQQGYTYQQILQFYYQGVSIY